MDFTKKTLLNIDETWIGTADFRRFSWCFRGESASLPVKQVQPRISMIVGLDSTGAVYMSLVQANSNTAMMELYFVTLIKLLDQKRPGWRKDTIILQDNAPYKTSKDMMAFYER
ncbi:MAG: transposase, partial [Candidatus Thermoplasmatota archaeon]|nr:transposase [Candidatus Thermoplasmatota archaeon]